MLSQSHSIPANVRGFTSFVRARLAASATTFVWHEHAVRATGNHLQSGWSPVATTHLHDVWRTSHRCRGALRRQGQFGLEQRRLLLRHGCFHSCVLHHIASRHVSAFFVLLTLRDRDVRFDDDFPLLHAAHRNMHPAMRKRRKRQVQSYLFNRLALRLFARHGV